MGSTSALAIKSLSKQHRFSLTKNENNPAENSLMLHVYGKENQSV